MADFEDPDACDSDPYEDECAFSDVWDDYGCDHHEEEFDDMEASHLEMPSAFVNDLELDRRADWSMAHRLHGPDSWRGDGPECYSDHDLAFDYTTNRRVHRRKDPCAVWVGSSSLEEAYCVPRYAANRRASVISSRRWSTHSKFLPSPREMESTHYSYSTKHSHRVHSPKGIYFDASSAPTAAFHSWHADCTRSREYFEYDELNMCENFDAYEVAGLGRKRVTFDCPIATLIPNMCEQFEHDWHDEYAGLDVNIVNEHAAPKRVTFASPLSTFIPAPPPYDLPWEALEQMALDTPLFDPLNDATVMADQQLFEGRIDAPMAEITAQQEELSIGLKNAMRCLELQRKIWAMGSSLCIIPAVPFHTFEDPFLLETCRINGVPIASPMVCFQGVLLHNLSHQWSYLGAAKTLSNKHFRLSSCVGQHLQREWLGTHLGARHTLWRPPETRTLFGTFWAVLRIWRIPTFHPLASRTKPSKTGENDVGMGYYFSCVSRHIVGERPPRARIRHVRLHSLATLLIRGRITSKRERMMQACKPSKQVMVVLAHLVLLGSTGARPSVRHQQHVPCPLVQPQHALHLKAKPTQPLSKDHHAKAHHTKALPCFN